MGNLKRDTVLQRVPELKLLIDSNNNIKIYFEGRIIHCGHHGLSLLDLFYQPTSLNDALSKLQARIKGAQDWMDLVTTFIHLHEAGILQDETQKRLTVRIGPHGYDAAPIHIAMLNDRGRTTNLIQGIHEVVRPEDIVVEIGTGTGILAIAAARAGARHVYAIEASGFASLAKEIFKLNGLSNRITLIEGWSTQIDLPEPADILISDLISSEPLAEHALETIADANKRLLKPTARLVPNRMKIFGVPVTIPRAELMKYQFLPETLDNWQSWYGIDFGLLDEAAKNSLHTFYIDPYLARDWINLSDPALLADLDFKKVSQLTIDNKIGITAHTPGQIDGLLEYFDLELAPSKHYSTHPKQVDKDCVRRNPVWVFPEPLILKKGDHFTIAYQYRKTEDKTKVSISRP